MCMFVLDRVVYMLAGNIDTSCAKNAITHIIQSSCQPPETSTHQLLMLLKKICKETHTSILEWFLIVTVLWESLCPREVPGSVPFQYNVLVLLFNLFP